MRPETDFSLWDKMKNSFIPLRKKHFQPDVPGRLFVRRKKSSELSPVLDLHHKTVQEAYLSTQAFIRQHTKLGTKQIQVITGKGRLKEGAIHSEFFGWLDTKEFQQYVRSAEWTNDKGAVKICLKKRK